MRVSLSVVAVYLSTLLSGMRADAASFDCAKARAPLEKEICSDPQLSAADDALARAYKAALISFPVPEFVRESQRVWLRRAPNCLKEPTVRACGSLFQGRIEELEGYLTARIYTDYGRAFSPEGTTLLVTQHGGATWLEWFGHWMPDAYIPKPYPDGFITHDSEMLTRRGERFVLQQADATLSIADEKLVVEEPGIFLSARQGPIRGEFARVRR